jgi:small conductance mechanosensitive channel
MNIDTLNVNGVEKYTDRIINLLIAYGPKVILAILVLIIGLFIINRISGVIEKILGKRHTDNTLSRFIVNMIGIVLKTLLIISVAQMVGIETTSFVAVMAAASLAIGMALQGSLGNFAGGALILFFRPYKIGDLIEAQGNIGNVKEIQLFTTHIVTPTNRLVIIPNGPMSNGNIINHSAEGKVRVDIKIAIAADENIDKARAIVMELLHKNPMILDEPTSTMNVSELGDNYTQFLVLAYSLPTNYWAAYFSIQEDIRKAFQNASIKGPQPLRIIQQA